MTKKSDKKKNKFTKPIIIISVLGILLIAYSHLIGTKGLFIREYSVVNDRIPESFNGLKIVHFTDLHYGSTYKIKEVKRLVKEINELNPDIVAFTGDLIEEKYNIKDEEINNLANELNKISSKLGKYIVRGNHDDNPGFQKVMDKLDFKDLNNKYDLIYYNDVTPILLVGLDDYLKYTVDIEKAFSYSNENDYYTILLVHEPDLIDRLSDKKIDLALAGHSHNGQIRLPFIGALWTPEGSKKYFDEKYEINGTTMYISGGLGTSTIEFRLFNHPSFNFYRLYSY